MAFIETYRSAEIERFVVTVKPDSTIVLTMEGTATGTDSNNNPTRRGFSRPVPLTTARHNAIRNNIAPAVVEQLIADLHINTTTHDLIQDGNVFTETPKP